MVKTCGLIPRYWEEKVRRISETPKLPKIYAYLSKYICIYDRYTKWGLIWLLWLFLNPAQSFYPSKLQFIHIELQLEFTNWNCQHWIFSTLSFNFTLIFFFFLQTLSQTLDLISTTLSIHCHRLYRLVQYSNLCW